MSVCGDKIRKLLLKEYNGRCAYCGGTIRKGELTVDHVKPKSFGGLAHIGNVRPSCRFCNMYKSDLSEGAFKEKIANALKSKSKSKYFDKVKNKYSMNDGKIKFYYEKMNEEREIFINKLYSMSSGETKL